MKNWENAEMVSGTIENKIVNSLKEVDFSKMELPMAVVYEKPQDFPDKYIVRIFDCNIPTNTLLIRDSLQDCREDITAAGFLACMERDSRDVLSIVETWIM